MHTFTMLFYIYIKKRLPVLTGSKKSDLSNNIVLLIYHMFNQKVKFLFKTIILFSLKYHVCISNDIYPLLL